MVYYLRPVWQHFCPIVRECLYFLDYIHWSKYIYIYLFRQWVFKLAFTAHYWSLSREFLTLGSNRTFSHYSDHLMGHWFRRYPNVLWYKSMIYPNNYCLILKVFVVVPSVAFFTAYILLRRSATFYSAPKSWRLGRNGNLLLSFWSEKKKNKLIDS